MAVWRYAPSLWSYGLVGCITVFVLMQCHIKAKRRHTLFLQFVDKQWYVVDHLGELYEVYLLRNWRSPWCISLQLASQLQVEERWGITTVLNRQRFSSKPYYFNLSFWRQQIGAKQWRELNVALSRSHAYAGLSQPKESL